MSELTDQMFGKYQLINRLAMGGMAEIFRAKLVGAAGFSREVVIKRIHPEFSEDEEFVRMFTNEAKWAALLRHPNIVQVLDFDRVDGTFYIAMEFIEGADLKRLQVRGRKSGVPLPHQLSLFVAIQALKGLAHAHQFEHDGSPLHIVHRDISPHNILISAQGEVKVTDFGIARVMQQSGVTASGVLKGKASYMAPEQTFSSQVDHRADLFAMGVVLWELLCRRRLFAGNNDLLAIHNVREARITPPRECDPTIPQELSDIVMEALARPLEQRVGDARIWMRQLQSYLWLPSAAEELSLYLQQVLNGSSVDAAFAQLDVFRPPTAIPSLDSMSNVSWSSLSPARPETAPLTPFVPEPSVPPVPLARPMTAQLDGWAPPVGKGEPAPGSLSGIRPEFAATGTANAFHESAPSAAKPAAPGHDWMIKTEAFGAAGSVGVMVDHDPEPPVAGMSVVSTVQVNPSHVLSVLSQGSGSPVDAAGLASADVRASHTIGAVETVQLDPAAQLLGLDNDPLAKTQLDSEDSTDMARQLAAMASQMAAHPDRETADVPIAETSLVEPARFLSAQVLQKPDADSTMRLRPQEPEPKSVHSQGPKANVAGWVVLGSSVLMVAALFVWLLFR